MRLGYFINTCARLADCYLRLLFRILDMMIHECVLLLLMGTLAHADGSECFVSGIIREYEPRIHDGKRVRRGGDRGKHVRTTRHRRADESDERDASGGVLDYPAFAAATAAATVGCHQSPGDAAEAAKTFTPALSLSTSHLRRCRGCPDTCQRGFMVDERRSYPQGVNG